MNEELAALGDAIRRIRKSRKISQMAVGELCGLHRTYICDIERGNRNMTFLSLAKVARALGTTTSEIIRHAEGERLLSLKPDSNNGGAPKGPSAKATSLGKLASSCQPRYSERRHRPER
jgi:transcriptional regulator with XRE-family HTH domain